MTVSTIAALLGAFGAVLSAEEILLRAEFPILAEDVRTVVEAIRDKAREAVETASAGATDALERVALLRQAIDLEGADSPLVARIAATFAQPDLQPAVALAG